MIAFLKNKKGLVEWIAAALLFVASLFLPGSEAAADRAFNKSVSPETPVVQGR